jgi:proteic killer suppression protein
VVPGYKLHPLSGELKGFWAVWVTGNYWIYFRFEDGNTFDINYSDYH